MIRQRVILWPAALFGLLLSTAPAFGMGPYQTNPAFLGVVAAIGATNLAMINAAKNPMDRWRREAVVNAIRGIPPALVGLAEAFRNVDIDPRKWSEVSALLGNYVNAADPYAAYEKFLKNPTADNIPRAGEGFPTSHYEYSKDGEASRTDTLPNLSPTRSPSKEGEPSPPVVGRVAATPPPALDALSNALDRGESDASPANFRIKVNPKFWQFFPAHMLMQCFLPPDAHAEGGEALGMLAEILKAIGENVAQILMGLAAIIMAAAPIAVAAIQAKADVSIAKINAKTQIQMTETTAATSKYLAGKQEEIALSQAKIAQDISKQNNDFQTKRLDMQLAELRSAREDARQAELEKQGVEKQYNDERIRLAKQQANDNLKLARDTLSSNLTQAGLTSGFTNSLNSGTRLSVATTTSSGQVVPGTATGVAGNISAGSAAGGLGAGAEAGASLSGKGIKARKATCYGPPSGKPWESICLGSAVGM